MLSGDVGREQNCSGMTAKTRRAFSREVLIDGLLAVPIGLALCFLALPVMALLPQENANLIPNTTFRESLLLVTVIYLAALQVGYFGALFIGAPLHFALVKLRLDNVIGYSLAGVVGSMLVVAIWLVPDWLYGIEQTTQHILSLLVYLGIPPVVIALVFGLFRRRRMWTDKNHS